LEEVAQLGAPLLMQVKVATVVTVRPKAVLVPTAISSEMTGRLCLSAPACQRRQLLQPGERPACD